MTQPFVPRTYKEELFARDDPIKTHAERITRGKRRVRYRQLEQDINAFPALVFTPLKPPDGSTSPTASVDSVSLRRRWVDDQRDRVGTPGGYSKGKSEIEDDGGWGPPDLEGSPKSDEQGWGTTQSVDNSNQDQRQTPSVTDKGQSPVPWNPVTHTFRSFQGYQRFQTPDPRNIPIPATPAPPMSRTPARIYPSMPDTPADSFRTPRQPWRGRLGPTYGGPAQRMINDHLGFETPLSASNSIPLPCTPQQGPRFFTQPTSHFFTPHTIAADSIPPTPATQSVLHHNPSAEHQSGPIKPTSPVPTPRISPITKPPPPEPPAPHVTARISPVNQGPSQSQLLDKMLSGLASAAPPASVTVTPHRQDPAPPSSTNIPETPAPHRIPWSERKTNTLLTQASAISKPSSNPQDTPIAPITEPLAVNLDELPQLTSDMRDRADIDAVLGRIRNARAQFSHTEAGGGDEHDPGRSVGGSRSGTATAPRSTRIYPDESSRGGDRNAELVDTLKKQNQEYERQLDKLNAEMGSLLSDIEVRGNRGISTAEHDAAIRRLNRSLKEKDDLLREAEKALLSQAQEPTSSTPRSRYADSPSPSRTPRDSRQANKLADEIVTLKAEMIRLRRDSEKLSTQLKDETERRKIAESTTQGARTQAGLTQKDLNAALGSLKTMEAQLGIERREKSNAMDRLRRVESDHHSNLSLRQEIGVVRNKLSIAQGEVANANEKCRDLGRRKADLEDKVKVIRREADGVHGQVAELREQLVSQERLIHEKEKLRTELKEANSVADRLRRERKEARTAAAEAREATQRLKRELEISKDSVASVHAQREEADEESRRAPSRPTLASEILSRYDAMRPTRRKSNPIHDYISDGDITETETVRGRARRASAPPTPSFREYDEVYVERRYKLQTPLHPDNTDTERDSAPTRRQTKDVPVISIMDEPIVIDQELKLDQQVRKPIKTSRYASSDGERTPPAPKMIPGAMIGLDTPISPPVVAVTEPTPLSDIDMESSDSCSTEQADIVIDTPSNPVEVKEKKETLRFIDDVFSEDPMISDLTDITDPIGRGKRRSYREDLEFLFYDPFAEIDDEFGLRSDSGESVVEDESDISVTRSLAESDCEASESCID